MRIRRWARIGLTVLPVTVGVAISACASSVVTVVGAPVAPQACPGSSRVTHSTYLVGRRRPEASRGGLHGAQGAGSRRIALGRGGHVAVARAGPCRRRLPGRQRLLGWAGPARVPRALRPARHEHAGGGLCRPGQPRRRRRPASGLHRRHRLRSSGHAPGRASTALSRPRSDRRLPRSRGRVRPSRRPAHGTDHAPSADHRRPPWWSLHMEATHLSAHRLCVVAVGAAAGDRLGVPDLTTARRIGHRCLEPVVCAYGVDGVPGVATAGSVALRRWSRPWLAGPSRSRWHLLPGEWRRQHEEGRPGGKDGHVDARRRSAGFHAARPARERGARVDGLCRRRRRRTGAYLPSLPRRGGVGAAATA